MPRRSRSSRRSTSASIHQALSVLAQNEKKSINNWMKASIILQILPNLFGMATSWALLVDDLKGTSDEEKAILHLVSTSAFLIGLGISILPTACSSYVELIERKQNQETPKTAANDGRNNVVPSTVATSSSTTNTIKQDTALPHSAAASNSTVVIIDPTAASCPSTTMAIAPSTSSTPLISDNKNKHSSRCSCSGCCGYGISNKHLFFLWCDRFADLNDTVPWYMSMIELFSRGVNAPRWSQIFLDVVAFGIGGVATQAEFDQHVFNLKQEEAEEQEEGCQPESDMRRPSNSSPTHSPFRRV